jgi:hypothetical protein
MRPISTPPRWETRGEDPGVWRRCPSVASARKLPRTRTCERHDAGDSRETALQGRVPGEVTDFADAVHIPGNAVSRAVEAFAEKMSSRVAAIGNRIVGRDSIS